MKRRPKRVRDDSGRSTGRQPDQPGPAKTQSATAAPDRIHGSWRTLVGRHRLWLALIVIASAGFRLTYFIELNRGPCVWTHHCSESDMNFFDAWARVIAGGDWLTDQALHPYHGWHQYAAEVSQGTSAVSPEAGQALWDDWYGGKRFHQEPLYPYCIALLYRMLGTDARWVFGFQMLIGVLSNVLIYLIARRHFGDLAAIVAGALAVFCGPLLFYEMVLLRPSLIVFATLGSVYLVDAAFERGRWPRWLLAGVALGLAILLKSTFALFVLGVACLLIVRGWRRPAALARQMGCLVGGILLASSPAIIRNVTVGASPLSLSSVATCTFVCANTVDYRPTEGFGVSLTYMPHIMAESQGRFWPAARAALQTHPSIGSYLRQGAGKFAQVWHWYEQPNNVNYYYFRLHARVLRGACVTFAVVAPLAIVGMILALSRLKSCGVLYIMVVSLLIPLVMFYVLARFRAPLLALLLPFAGFAVARLVGFLREKRMVLAVLGLAGVAALGWWISRPLAADQEVIRMADYLMPFQAYYTPLEKAAYATQNWPAVAEVLEESLQWTPPVVRQMGPARQARNPSEASAAAYFAAAHHRYAQLLRQQGQSQAAATHEKRAAELQTAATAGR